MRNKKRAVFLFTLVTISLLSIGCNFPVFQTPTETATSIPSPSNTPEQTPTKTLEILETPPITSGPFNLVAIVNQVIAGTVDSLITTEDGSLWLTTDKGVVKIADMGLSVYLSDMVGKIAGIDSSGRVWVVNEDMSQIAAWNGKAGMIYGIDSGWTPVSLINYPYVRGGRTDSLGRVWFATSQDVRYLQGNLWTVVTPQEMSMEPSTQEDLMPDYNVFILEDGNIWVAECDWSGPGPFGGQGIRWLDNGIWKGKSSPVASGCATTIAEDSTGHVWAGVENSLWRYDPASDTWEEFTPPESPIADMRFGFVNSIAIDPDDSLWSILVLCGGASCFGNSVLYHLQDGTWNQIGEVSEFDYGYWGPLFDVEGTSWVFWMGGIYRIQGDTPELVSPLAGRLGTVDGSGKLWLVAPYEGQDALWVLSE
jgi:streptogramin lyase